MVVVVVVVVGVVAIGFRGAGATGFSAPFLFFFGFRFSLPCRDLSPIKSLPFRPVGVHWRQTWLKYKLFLVFWGRNYVVYYSLLIDNG